MTALSWPNTENSRACCIIYGYHFCCKWPHLWTWPLQMLFNCISNSCWNHGWCWTTMQPIHGPSASFVLHTEGCLGKNSISVSHEQIVLLSSIIRLGTSSVSFWILWDHLPPQHSTSSYAHIAFGRKRFKFTFLFLVSSAGHDRIRETGHCIQKTNVLIKGNKYSDLDGS